MLMLRLMSKHRGEVEERKLDALLLFFEWCELINKKEKEAPQELIDARSENNDFYGIQLYILLLPSDYGDYG